MQPYFIRLRDAPLYLGMDKNLFNVEVRPTVQKVPIGKHGIGFDRHDLDAWAVHYKALHAQPAERSMCDKSTCSVCSNTALSNPSIKKITDQAFAKALAQAISKKT